MRNIRFAGAIQVIMNTPLQSKQQIDAVRIIMFKGACKTSICCYIGGGWEIGPQTGLVTCLITSRITYMKRK